MKGKTNVPGGKLDYLFGRASGRQHNLARTNQNALQMKRLGVPDITRGHELLTEHLKKVPDISDNIIREFSSNYGTFEIRESLFAGPSGRLKLGMGFNPSRTWAHSRASVGSR